jgi:hypothetical protein
MPMLMPGTPFEGGEAHVGHFREPHEVTVRTAPDHERAEVLFAIEAGLGAQREFALRGFEPAGRQLDVFPAQRVLDVDDGELPRSERFPVDPHPHRVAASAVDAHPGHPGQHPEPLDEHAVGVIGELEHVERVAREVEVHDRLGVEVHLADLGRIRLLRQLRRHTRHAVPHVVRGFVHRPVRCKLEIDTRTPVDTLRGDLGDALEPRDAVLDDLRDLRFHHVRRRAAVIGLDRDYRRFHVGQFSDRQARRG